MKPDLMKQLRMAINKSDMNISELAKESKVPQPVIHRIANKQRNGVNLRTAAKLAKALGFELTLKKKK